MPLAHALRSVVLIQHSVYHLFDNSYLIDAVRRHTKLFRVQGMVDDSQPNPGEQMKKLLETGKTNLLKGFVSNRTRKKFSAYLTRGADGKVGFEFEVRAPKAPKAAAAKAADKPAKAAKEAAPAKAKPAAKKRVAKK